MTRLPVDPGILIAALAGDQRLRHLRPDDLAPLSNKGTAHGHVAIVPEIEGRRLALRIAYAHEGDVSAAARLAAQAEAFRRAEPAGVTPALFAVVPPAAGLPGGALVVDRIDGRPPLLPNELPQMARTLVAIHGLPVPAPEAAAPMAYAVDPVASLLSAIETNARYFDAMPMPPETRAALAAELRFARDFAADRQRAIPPIVFALADTHPGNFLVDAAGRMWFVDLEKAHYGCAAVDLAHATLYTSTRWDADVDARLTREQVARFYLSYLQAIGTKRAAALLRWLLPLRRMTWLRTMAFCARWRMQTDPAYDGREPDRWSDAGLSSDMKRHSAATIADFFRPETTAAVRHEWLGPQPLELGSFLAKT